MKLLALLPLAALAADVVVASTVPARHHRLARAFNRKKRCLARPQNASSSAHSSATSPQVTYPTSTPPPAQEQPPTTTTTTTDKAPPASSPPPTYNPPAQHQSGTINVASTCGDIGATCEFSRIFHIPPCPLIASLCDVIQPILPPRVVPMAPSIGSTVASRMVAGAHPTSLSTK
jgi:hypothetical protein